MKHIVRCFSSLVALLSVATIASAQSEGNTQTVEYDPSAGTLTLGGDFSTWPDLSEYKLAYTIVFAPDFQATTIGKQAFKSFPNVSEIVIPSTITSIEDEAFYKCISLFDVTIPEGVTSIGERAFYGCAFISIDLPKSIETIAYQAFQLCDNLESIVIPEGVKRIEGYTFLSCEGLKEVTLPASLESIGDGAFSDCDRITSVVLKANGTESDKHYVTLGEADVTDKTASGEDVFSSTKAKLTYNPKTTYVGGDDDDNSTDNLRAYFSYDRLVKLSDSPTSLRLTPAAGSAAQYYDLGGRRVKVDMFRGVAVRVEGGKSSVVNIK